MIIDHVRSVPETNSSSSHYVVFSENYKRKFPVFLRKINKDFLDYGDVLENPEDIVCYMYSQAFYNNVSHRFIELISKRPEFKIFKNFNSKTFDIDHQSIISLHGNKDTIANFLVDLCIDILKNGKIVIADDSLVTTEDLNSGFEIGRIYEMYVYKNGNSYTLIEKLRNNSDFFEKFIIKFNNDPEHVFIYPNQVDIKITNYCEHNCWFCHEKSNKEGKCADYYDIVSILYTSYGNLIPEVCLGGGNVLTYPFLHDLVYYILENNSFVSFSVNWKDVFNTNLFDILNIDRFRISLGISMGTFQFDDVKLTNKFISKLTEIKNNFVFHFIDGVNTTEQIENFYKALKKRNHTYHPMLILGFKQNLGYNVKLSSRIDIERLCKNYTVYVDEIFAENRAFKHINTETTKQYFFNERCVGDKKDKLFIIDFSDYLYIDVVEKKYDVNSAKPKERMLSYKDGMSIECLFKNVVNFVGRW